MIFTTPEFVLFAVAFAAAFAVTRGRGRKAALLLASYLFYGAWDPRFLALLIGSTVLDFWVGRALAATDDPGRRRRLVGLSLTGNLGVLGIFKYLDFFVASATAALAGLGIGVSPASLEIILPVGISFYTFQTLSYTIDVYRRRIEPTGSWLDFANYVAFFPQLVAGPIERAGRLLPQMSRVGDPWKGDGRGFGLIALGAFKKVVIADNLAPLVDLTYADPSTTHAAALWIGTYAFAVQIYCDFSGYSDIAIGLSRLMGIELVQNFDAPYGAAGPREFWRRWHISLSTWLRDYLYIPLGGNRGSRSRTAANLAVTMLLGGLWHGAAWNFVLWGAFHGALLGLGRVGGLSRGWSRIPVAIRRLVFFHVVCLGWALFRAESLGDCGIIWAKLLDPTAWDLGWWIKQVRASGEATPLMVLGGLMGATVFGQMTLRRDSLSLVDSLWKMPWVVRVYVVALLLFACAVLAPEAPPPFLYFQF